MSKWLSELKLKWAMKGLFQGINADDMILFNREKTKAFSRGEMLPKERMIKLKEEVEYFSHSFFWRDICDKNIRYTAQELEMARKDGELPLGKGMILTLDTIKKAINDIQNFNIGKSK